MARGLYLPTGIVRPWQVNPSKTVRPELWGRLWSYVPLTWPGFRDVARAGISQAGGPGGLVPDTIQIDGFKETPSGRAPTIEDTDAASTNHIGFGFPGTGGQNPEWANDNVDVSILCCFVPSGDSAQGSGSQPRRLVELDFDVGTVFMIGYDDSAEQIEVRVAAGSGANQLLSGTGSFPASTLKPIAALFTYDHVTLRLYVDGEEIATSTTSDNVGNPEDYTIGSNAASGRGFFGEMIAVGIWQRALLPAEAVDVTFDPHLPIRERRRRAFAVVAAAVTQPHFEVRVPVTA